MAFPNTPLPVAVEIAPGGSPVDITGDVRARDRITISRGRPDEGARVDPGSCTLTLNNRSGTYSPRNPLGPYYGQLGRNTPLRVSVRTGTPYLDLPGGDADRATTPDHASLDITGDIDVRVEARLTDWSANTQAVELAGKWQQGTSQRSWLLFLFHGTVWFYWSTDGSAEIHRSGTAALAVPPSGRLAVRATLDVNDGSGNNVLTFYTAPSLGGPWTQLGSPVVTAGVTSIFNSTASLDVGGVLNAGFDNPVGALYAFELRNGIGGTLAAAPDFTAQTVGVGSFTDSAGRTWTVSGAASITNRVRRFTGEVSSWPARWDVSGQDVYVPVEAAGILRRLGQGAKPLDSTLRRRIVSLAPLAYWPMEEPDGATQAYSPIAGVRPLTASEVTWGQADSLPSSQPLPVLASGGGSLPRLYAPIPAPVGTPSVWEVQWVYRLDTVNTTGYTFMRIVSTGTVAEWYIQQRNNQTSVLGYDTNGSTVVNQAIGTGTELYGQWVRLRFTLSQSGGTVNWEIAWAWPGAGAQLSGGSYSGTTGRPTACTSPPDGFAAALDGMAIGHLSAWAVLGTDAYENADSAWAGETAGVRMLRLAYEEGLPLMVYGDTTVQEQVGAQRPDTLLTLVEDAAAADGGSLYERRDAAALAYRGRATLYNQPVALALDYAGPGVAPPLEPTDDDQHVRNDITVQRVGGSSARAVRTTGPLSTAPPPAGVGTYDEQVTLNLYSDDQPEQHAAWRLHLGTWDEARYPTVHVNLAAAPHLIDAATAVDVGDRITIANLPSWLPPGVADLIVTGYTETIGPYEWDIVYTCMPAGPWTVARTNADAKAGSSTSTLAAGVSASATTLSVAVTPGSALWTTDPAQMPISILVGGEEMTVTGISGTSSPQTFTVTRAANGISKSHNVDAAVRLAQPAVVAL
ncbi:hypothetical protein RKE29_01980 [Streptomyces sp. B1866]|uniref:hypothetical protein n=1 Tax=Streptomyces sp. B1866 TaxID=3075431 RepID=UPI00288DAC52|nr:hypothetical protein [Streptomyces sp. B1866]MDT3395429.1 hypothetical protein [Streptomyces sp. B1866]